MKKAEGEGKSNYLQMGSTLLLPALLLVFGVQMRQQSRDKAARIYLIALLLLLKVADFLVAIESSRTSLSQLLQQKKVSLVVDTNVL